jgi:hypothetical protein
MADYFGPLAARALGRAQLISPRAPSVYEAGWTENLTESEEFVETAGGATEVERQLGRRQARAMSRAVHPRLAMRPDGEGSTPSTGQAPPEAPAGPGEAAVFETAEPSTRAAIRPPRSTPPARPGPGDPSTQPPTQSLASAEPLTATLFTDGYRLGSEATAARAIEAETQRPVAPTESVESGRAAVQALSLPSHTGHEPPLLRPQAAAGRPDALGALPGSSAPAALAAFEAQAPARVTVSIGRIELRAVRASEPPQPAPKPAPRQPRLGLQEYLRRQRRGTR